VPEVAAEHLVLRLAIAHAEPGFDPATAQHVDKGDLLSRLDGGMQGQQRNRRADSNGRRARRDGRCQGPALR